MPIILSSQFLSSVWNFIKFDFSSLFFCVVAMQTKTISTWIPKHLQLEQFSERSVAFSDRIARVLIFLAMTVYTRGIMTESHMPCFSLSLSSIKLLAVQDLADREALDKVLLHFYTHLFPSALCYTVACVSHLALVHCVSIKNHLILLVKFVWFSG